MSLGTVASVVGIVGGVSSLMRSSSGGDAQGQATQSAQLQQQAALQAQQLAQERWDYYKARADRVLPAVQGIEDQVFSEASAGVRNRAPEERAMAAADVEQSFGREADATKRRMQAAGIDTSSPRAMALLNNLSINKAKNQALAMNQAGRAATNRAEDMDYTRRIQALSLDKGLPVPGMEGASAAFGNAANTALRVADANNTQAAQGGYALQRGLTGLSNSWGSTAGTTGTSSPDYNFNDASGRNSPDYNFNDPIINTGNPELGYRDGGVVRRRAAITFENGGDVEVGGSQVMDPGAGGGTDTIPAVIDGQKRAALNSGEFVVPTDVVRMKGVEFFQKLIEKYHRRQPSKGMANGGAIQLSLPRAIEDAIYSTMTSKR